MQKEAKEVTVDGIIAGQKLSHSSNDQPQDMLCLADGTCVGWHDRVEGMTPLRIGPLPISSRTIEVANTGLQKYVAGQNIRHRAISGVPLCGQLGSCICLLVLYNIRVCWGPPELEIDACRLQGAHHLSGPVHKGSKTL